MKVYRYEHSLAGLYDEGDPIVFLAGPTVREHQPHLTSWRFAAIDAFSRQGFDGVLVVPEFTGGRESDKAGPWIPPWEFAGLSASDVILFWIPRTRELLGMTTNHEHGYWLARTPEKVVYGRPDESYRNEYLDQMWEMDAQQHGRGTRPIHRDLEETVKDASTLARQTLQQHRVRSRLAVDSPFGPFQI